MPRNRTAGVGGGSWDQQSVFLYLYLYIIYPILYIKRPSFPVRRSPGGENVNPLQYSCLKNFMDRGPWRGYSLWGCRVRHN